MEKQKAGRVFIYFLAAAGAACLSLPLLDSISDPDFFWHLKTGEWIWRHTALPQQDPFSFTSPAQLSAGAHFTLTAYWLAQVTYHLIDLVCGLRGIVFLRFVLTGALACIMLKRKHGDNLVYAGLIAVFLTALLELYPMDRPQVFSFIAFAVLLSLMEKIRSGNSSTAVFFAVAVVMLLWSNMHGGYVLGQGALLLYAASEGIKFIHPSLGPPEKPVYARLVAAALLGIVFSLANPNSYYAAAMISGGAPKDIIEYQSSVHIFRTYAGYGIVLYWSLLLLAVGGVAADLKKQDISEVLLLAGTGLISFMQMRYIPFFMIAALPFIGRSLSRGRMLKHTRRLIFAAAMLITVLFAVNKAANVGNMASGNWVNTYYFPEKASDFIAKNDLRGNMFNFYDWGGYLIWRLGPERKVFADGRGLYPDIVAQAQLISAANRADVSGVPFWKAALDNYDIKFVVIPLFQRSGKMVRLVDALVTDKDWVPVFYDLNSMIFVKNSKENHQAINNFAVPKSRFLNDLIRVCDRLIAAVPKKIPPYIAKGDLLLAGGKFTEAKEMYEKAAGIAPLNPVPGERLEMMDRRIRQKD